MAPGSELSYIGGTRGWFCKALFSSNVQCQCPSLVQRPRRPNAACKYRLKRAHVHVAFGVHVKKVVVPSLESLTCQRLSPLLRHNLVALLSNTGPIAAEEIFGKPTDDVSKEIKLEKRVYTS